MDLKLRETLHPAGARANRRFASRVQARDAMSDHPVIAGYASIFSTEYTVYDWFGPYTEEIVPGAFTKTLAERDDVRFFYNHDGLVLARTKNDTLQLAQDEIGLNYVATMDGRMTAARDLAIAVENRNVDQSSFMFEITRQEWNGDYTKCWIKEVKLWDTSAVAFPASESTSAGIRMKEMLEALRSANPDVVAAELRRASDPQRLARDLVSRFSGLAGRAADDEAAEEDEEVSHLQALGTLLEAASEHVQAMLNDEAEDEGDSDGISEDAATAPAERDTPATMTVEQARREAELMGLRRPA